MDRNLILTAHFTLHEFDLYPKRGFDFKPYPEEWIDDRLRPLCLDLEVIRARIDEPILILSGYRTREYNINIAGADQSRHIYGEAADITVRSLPSWKLFMEILELHREKKLTRIRGLGIYDTHCHVDIRATKRLISWDLRKK